MCTLRFHLDMKIKCQWALPDSFDVFACHPYAHAYYTQRNVNTAMGLF